MAKKSTSREKCWKSKQSGDNKAESSNAQGCIASTSDDGKILYSETTIVVEGRKWLASVWLIDLGVTWHMTTQK